MFWLTTKEGQSQSMDLRK